MRASTCYDQVELHDMEWNKMPNIPKKIAVAVSVSLVLVFAISDAGQAQMSGDHSGGNMQGHDMHATMMHGGKEEPKEAGQDAFATLQEIITLLQNDADTDWSRVNITALREHLVDMNDLVLKSTASQRQIAGGLEMDVSGKGRVREALGRMVPAHAPMLVTETGWRVVGERTATGARLTVTSDDPAQAQRIRALGFYGLMATGAHHQMHHLGMARGDMVHGG